VMKQVSTPSESRSGERVGDDSGDAAARRKDASRAQQVIPSAMLTSEVTSLLEENNVRLTAVYYSAFSSEQLTMSVVTTHIGLCIDALSKQIQS
jgi:ABC-type polar amino acid transport system ATPase subunit